MTWSKSTEDFVSDQGTTHEIYINDATGNRYLNLKGEGFYKDISDISNIYRNIRVGVSLFLNNFTSTISPAPTFYFGLCNSNTGIPGQVASGDIGDFVGITNNTGQDLTYLTNYGEYGRFYGFFTTIKNGTFYNYSIGSPYYIATNSHSFNSGSEDCLTPITFDLHKTTDFTYNYSLSTLRCTSETYVRYGVKRKNFIDTINNYGSLLGTNLNYYSDYTGPDSSRTTIDTASLDTIVLYWGDTTAGLAYGDFIAHYNIDYNSPFYNS